MRKRVNLRANPASQQLLSSHEKAYSRGRQFAKKNDVFVVASDFDTLDCWVGFLLFWKMRLEDRQPHDGVAFMNPQLYIFKRYELEHFDDNRNRIYFVIVNLDKAKKYPANFVCVLPTQKNSIVKQLTEFSRLFGQDSLRLARQLLKDALKEEDDGQIRTEIEKRLKRLEPERAIKRGYLRHGQYWTFKTLQESVPLEGLKQDSA